MSPGAGIAARECEGGGAACGSFGVPRRVRRQMRRRRQILVGSARRLGLHGRRQRRERRTVARAGVQRCQAPACVRMLRIILKAGLQELLRLFPGGMPRPAVGGGEVGSQGQPGAEEGGRGAGLALQQPTGPIDRLEGAAFVAALLLDDGPPQQRCWIVRLECAQAEQTGRRPREVPLAVVQFGQAVGYAAVIGRKRQEHLGRGHRAAGIARRLACPRALEQPTRLPLTSAQTRRGGRRWCRPSLPGLSPSPVAAGTCRQPRRGPSLAAGSMPRRRSPRHRFAPAGGGRGRRRCREPGRRGRRARHARAAPARAPSPPALRKPPLLRRSVAVTEASASHRRS